MTGTSSVSSRDGSAPSAASVVAIAAGNHERLGRQIAFILEIDRLKTIIRRSLITDASRLENTAEHSWHLAMLALTLGEWASPEVDVDLAIKLLLVHDIVEVDAGDTYIYDDEGRLDKEQREQAAADRIFGLLPADQAESMRALWDEYERRDTPTGRFAYAIDRLQPLLLNASTGGAQWLANDIAEHQVRRINGPIADGSEELWRLADSVIADAVAAGVIRTDGTNA